MQTRESGITPEGYDDPYNHAPAEENFAEMALENSDLGRPSPKEVKKKFVVLFKKGQEEQAQFLTDCIDKIGDSPIGPIPFEDIVLYLFEHKLQESDFEAIRSSAFDRKMVQAQEKYNRENKTHYSMKEFLAIGMDRYFH